MHNRQAVQRPIVFIIGVVIHSFIGVKPIKRSMLSVKPLQKITNRWKIDKFATTRLTTSLTTSTSYKNSLPFRFNRHKDVGNVDIKAKRPSKYSIHLRSHRSENPKKKLRKDKKKKPFMRNFEGTIMSSRLTFFFSCEYQLAIFFMPFTKDMTRDLCFPTMSFNIFFIYYYFRLHFIAVIR